MNAITKLTNYIKDSHRELKKVIWPSKKEVTHHTMLVIGISTGVALFLGAVDKILDLIFQLIIS